MTTKQQYIPILQKFMAEHGTKYGIKRLGIFGSVVRDEHTSESDVDILIEFGKPIGIEFIDMSHLLETELKRRVDVVSYKGVKEKYFKEIEKDIVYV